MNLFTIEFQVEFSRFTDARSSFGWLVVNQLNRDVFCCLFFFFFFFLLLRLNSMLLGIDLDSFVCDRTKWLWI